MDFCISCASGLESILKKEIQLAWYKVTNSVPKLISFTGDLFAIAKINLRSRVGNKLYLKLSEKEINSFDELFEVITTIDRSKYISPKTPILITASSKDSQLSSTPAIQGIVKKAIIKKLLKGEGTREEMKEKPPIEIHIHLEKNICSILLNTTGDSLHKRWYKLATWIAPINESLAAGLLLLSWWKFHEPLYDIFCGSWTIVIEAALIAKNIAPWHLRTFAFQQFTRYDQSLLIQAKKEAESKIITNKQHTIIWSDNDPKMITIAKMNAKKAGVENHIQFQTKEIQEYITWPEITGTLVSNPPYGLRFPSKDVEQTHKQIAEIFAKNAKLHGWIITSYENFEQLISMKWWKKSKLYNGGELCYFYKKTLS